MHFKDILQRYSPAVIIESLAPFLTEDRKKRIDSVLKKRVKKIQVALEAPTDIHNALAVTRSGEALGIYHFHLIDAQLVKGQGKATMRGSSRWIHLYEYADIDVFQNQMHNFILAGASLEGNVTLEELPVDRPICLLFGNERYGLSNKARNYCDLLYRIPMVGMVESFNLSVSAAISLYTLMKKKNKGDLNIEEKQAEKASYYLRSIGMKVAQNILERMEGC